jgi:hypothetical protein
MPVIINFLFGCRHKQITRPITPVHKPGTRAEQTYVACLECGTRLRYDLESMRVGTVMPPPAAPANVIAARSLL